MGNPKNMVGISREHKDPGRFVPIIFLLDAWGSLLSGSHLSPFGTGGSVGSLFEGSSIFVCARALVRTP